MHHRNAPNGHDPFGMILYSLGDVLRGLGRLEEGQEHNRGMLRDHSQRLGTIEQRQAVIFERVHGQEVHLDQMDKRTSSTSSPSLGWRDWLRLVAALAVLAIGLLAQIPIDKIPFDKIAALIK